MSPVTTRANHEADSNNLSTIEHYRLLIHFTPKMLRGDLWRGEGGGEYLQVQEHYARLVNDEVSEFLSLRNKNVLDIGGHSGVFCRVFSEEFGAKLAINLEPFFRYDKQLHWPDRVRGVAQELPFGDDQFDLVFCREVLEHVQPQGCLQRCVNEMYRVTKKGGLCYISIPPWHAPFAGHACMPFHYLPFRAARRLALLFYKTPFMPFDVTSWEEYGIFPITFKKMRRLIAASGFRVLATKDHHFRLHFLTRIPLAREVAVPVVAFILRK
jgi:SAM-dependent methyltransferase